MGSIITKSIKTPVGEILLGVHENQLCLADWKYRRMRPTIDKRIQDALESEYEEGNHPVLDQTEQQLTQYFEGNRKEFDIPLLLVGTDFQKTVWNALLEIPYGTTSTYLALSQKLENEKAIRAVASANGANAISIIVPCHRIIGSDGSLVGYAGGLSAKKKLLRLEHAPVMQQTELF